MLAGAAGWALVQDFLHLSPPAKGSRVSMPWLGCPVASALHPPATRAQWPSDRNMPISQRGRARRTHTSAGEGAPCSDLGHVSGERPAHVLREATPTPAAMSRALPWVREGGGLGVGSGGLYPGLSPPFCFQKGKSAAVPSSGSSCLSGQAPRASRGSWCHAAGAPAPCASLLGRTAPHCPQGVGTPIPVPVPWACALQTGLLSQVW